MQLCLILSCDIYSIGHHNMRAVFKNFKNKLKKLKKVFFGKRQKKCFFDHKI
jgi:hypothetical protein